MSAPCRWAAWALGMLAPLALWLGAAVPAAWAADGYVQLLWLSPLATPATATSTPATPAPVPAGEAPQASGQAPGSGVAAPEPGGSPDSQSPGGREAAGRPLVALSPPPPPYTGPLASAVPPALTVGAWDPTGSGEDLLVVGHDSGLSVYRLAGDQGLPLLLAQFSGVAGGVRTLQTADLDEDSRTELVAGTGQAGELLVLAWVPDAVGGGQLRLAARAGYLFGAVTQVWAAELDGIPPRELVAVNERGDLFAFAQDRAGTYRRIWRSPPSREALRYVAAGDANGDGRTELILSRSAGDLRVFRWSADAFVESGESYPWGSIRALAVSPSSPPRLLVLTNRSVVDVYSGSRAPAGGLQLQSQLYDPQLAPRLNAEVLRVTPDPAGQRTLMLTAGPPGLSVLAMDGERMILDSSAPFVHQVKGAVLLRPDKLVVQGVDGDLTVLKRVPGDWLSLQVLGESVPWNGRVRWDAGDFPKLTLRDLAMALGIRYTWESTAEFATLRSGPLVARLTPGVAELEVNGYRMPLSQAPELYLGRLFVPFDVFTAFGWRAWWDPWRRSLELTRLPSLPIPSWAHGAEDGFAAPGDHP